MRGRNLKILLGSIGAIIVISLGIIILYKTVFAIKLVEVVSIEAGSEIPDISAFFEEEQTAAVYLTDVTTIPIDKPGVYDIQLQVKDKEYTSKLEIKDTIPPEAEVIEFEIWPEEVKTAEDFVKNIVDVTNVKVSFQQEPDYNKTGTQEVAIVLEDASGNTTVKKVSLIIKADEESPIITGVQDYTIFAGEEIDYKKGVEVADNRDDNVELKIDSSAVNLNKAGQYQVVYNATDKAGNTASETATIIVKADTEAPTITGVKNQTVIVGGSVSYKKNVEVTDNRDESVELQIDSSAVNLKKIGTYQVVYKAVDKAGNTTSKTATITVIEKPKVSEAELNKLADKVLAKIITPGMSDVDKLWAIYKWSINNIQYTGSSDKSDWMEGAMRGFTKGTGDCFNYYATTRILMDRAGFENKTVTRINGETQHFWNLVYVENGWYHVDTTPHRRSHPDTTFLRTDAELKRYSTEEVEGYYRFDESKYPATPTEAPAERSKYVHD